MILVVDDDPNILQLVEAILTTNGYKVLVAPGARRALEVFESQESLVQLLLTDIIMPDLTGPVLAMRLRARRPDLRVLFMSGFHDTAMVRNFIAAQDIRVLPKPFTTDGLLRAVRDTIS